MFLEIVVLQSPWLLKPSKFEPFFRFNRHFWCPSDQGRDSFMPTSCDYKMKASELGSFEPQAASHGPEKLVVGTPEYLMNSILQHS